LRVLIYDGHYHRWPSSISAIMFHIMKERIFLDNAAGRNNPNAIYHEGREARARLESARARIAKVLSVATDEIIFTPWGTEANILVTASLQSGLTAEKSHVITTQIEHKSMLDALKHFPKVTYLKPDHEGLISVKQVEQALRPETKLVSIMYANNEIGTIQPIKEIARMLRRKGTRSAEVLGKNPQTVSITSSHSPQPLFHSDCVQAPGLLPINMQSLGVDLASFSAAKFGGPDGIGFLFRRRGVELPGVRDAGAVDLVEQMAVSLEKASKLTGQQAKKLETLRDYFIAEVLKNTGALLNGSHEVRLANNANFVFPIDSELLVLELDRYGIAASAGAACSSGECDEGSHVILALGKSKKESNQSVRFSLGYDTKKSDLDYVVKILRKVINKHTNLWQKN